MKMFTGIDLAAWGEWSVYAGFDPNVPSAKDPVAINLQPTVGLLGAVALQGASTHISLTLSNKAEGSALLSSIVIHYQTNGKAD
jgi:hypothetical protein